MTYIRLTEDVKGLRDEVILKQGQLGKIIGGTKEGLEIVLFDGPNIMELSRNFFKELTDDDELRVVNIEHEDKEICYTLTEDQLNTNLATIYERLRNAKHPCLEIDGLALTVTFTKMTLKEIDEMHKLQEEIAEEYE